MLFKVEGKCLLLISSLIRMRWIFILGSLRSVDHFATYQFKHA